MQATSPAKLGGTLCTWVAALAPPTDASLESLSNASESIRRQRVEDGLYTYFPLTCVGF